MGQALERLIHNYYIDFMINLKNNTDDVFFDSINSYEFNYGSKTIHQHKLYEDLDKEYPKCAININQITARDNEHFRNNGSLDNSNQFQNIAENRTREELLAASFRWVNIGYSIVLSFENGMDVLNYNDMLIQRFPTGITFYQAEYQTFIEIQNEWDPTDDTDNVFYRVDHTSKDTRCVINYFNDPRYTINSIVQNIDTKNDKYSLTVEYNCELKIPGNLKAVAKDKEVIDIIVTIGAGGTGGAGGNDLEDFETRIKPSTSSAVDSSYHHQNISALFILNKEDLFYNTEFYEIHLVEEYNIYIKDRKFAIVYEDSFITFNENDYIIEAIKDEEGNFISNKLIINKNNTTEELNKLHDKIDFKNLKLAVY